MSKIKIYKASAGSGKTYTLALEYIRELLMASSDENYRHILAVTFTKDATGEMKDRILAELYGLAFRTEDSAGFLVSLQEALKEAHTVLTDQQIQEKAEKALHAILHDYSRLNITTIDSFFQKVLRNLARELGKGSKFNLEMNTGKVLQEAVHATIEKANQNKQILEWLTTYIEHRMDDERNWRIENEIFEFSKCIYDEFFQENEQVLRRQLQENPLVFKELKKQQEEVKQECKHYFTTSYQKVQQALNTYGLTADDFIRKGIPVHFFRKLAEGNYKAEINKTIQDCSEDAACWTTKSHNRKAEIQALAASTLIPLLNDTIQALKVMLTSQMITGNLHQLGLIWDITKEIAGQNAENNRFMLSDTAMFLNEMIDDSDAPFIYEKIGSDIQHVMIDEFQDTSRLQWKNFKALLSNIIANDSFSLIVGDVKQSIYRWRNGDWRILNQIGNELHATVKSLEYNFRSEKVIIDFNNRFFTCAAGLLDQLYKIRLNDHSPSPFLSTYDEKDVQQKTHKKTDAGYVSVDFVADKQEGMAYPEQMQEAVFLQLKKLYEAGIPAGDICILTRKNKEIITLADYLSSRKNEFPEMAQNNYLNIVSDEAFQLKSSLAVKIIIEALKTIAQPDNPVHQAQLQYLLTEVGAGYRVHGARYADAEALPVHRAPFTVHPDAQRRCMPLFELTGHLYRLHHLEEIDGQSAYLFAFYDSVTKYLNEKPAGLPEFLQYWEDELKYKTIPAGAGVTGLRAMTIHKSKGLQFSTVIIPYCDWNIQPKTNDIVWCSPKQDLYDLALLPVNYTNVMQETVFAPEYEEETAQSWMDNLNILYVGFTRAERNLILLGKYKKTLDVIDRISTVSDLLQLSVTELNGRWDAVNLHFETGNFGMQGTRCTVHGKESDNPLKQIPPPVEATFVSKAFQADKSIFKQSNQSREFVSATPPTLHPAPFTVNREPRTEYVAYGNIMHNLFEQITRPDTIEKAIDNLIIQGVIHPDEKADYVEKIHTVIRESQVEHWFSGEYKSYQEHSILTEEDGEVVSKRPDRVLISDKETIIIDYKFGKAHPSHKKQVQQYMKLLDDMKYPNIKGYLWYVEERKVEKVN